MVEPDIRINYDGGDANGHSIDMRLLGSSLQGADRIISDGLIVLIHGRVPKRRERAPVIAKVREPLEGSYSLWAFWEAAKGMLPLGLPSATQLAGFFIGQWWDAVIAKFTGNSVNLEKAMEILQNMQRDQLAARGESEARYHELAMAQNSALIETIAMQGRAIEQFVAPIGPSVDRATIFPIKTQPSLITTSDADIIRESQKLEWQAVSELRLRTDGFRFHTGGLSVENPERDGYLMARVLDHRFDNDENEYTAAAQRRSSIAVLARKGYKGAELVAIEILEFLYEIPS